MYKIALCQDFFFSFGGGSFLVLSAARHASGPPLHDGASVGPGRAPWRVLWGLKVTKYLGMASNHGVAFRRARAEQDNGKSTYQRFCSTAVEAANGDITRLKLSSVFQLRTLLCVCGPLLCVCGQDVCVYVLRCVLRVRVCGFAGLSMCELALGRLSFRAVDVCWTHASIFLSSYLYSTVQQPDTVSFCSTPLFSSTPSLASTQ